MKSTEPCNRLTPMNLHNDRRRFLTQLGLGALAAGAALAGCKPRKESPSQAEGQMTYRRNPKTGESVSLLGYGCMRWPTVEATGELDQEAINALVDEALAHGVNYFDTSPAYCKGASERATGIALSRHPRSSYFIATKLSNFAGSTRSREKSIEMYHNSFRELQVDYIDYMLLHSVGGGDGLPLFRQRYIDNGMLDFLLAEREAGRIRNLGFSFHGDVKVFEHLLAEHPRYKWDFVQIQMNYLDWRHAKHTNERNVNAEYLYQRLEKLNIPVVIMEPLLGGRLAQVPDHIATRLKQREPERSVASWAFRFAGTHPGVLTVLSGMTYMEHLRDNLHTYSPLQPLTEEELGFLHDTADLMMQYKTIPCNDCKYCMPCPYGLNIPAILLHYNKCLNEGNIIPNTRSEDYNRARRAFLIGYNRSVPKLRQAAHCIGCGKCLSHCPQNIDIPQELQNIDLYVEQLRTGVSDMQELISALDAGNTIAIRRGRGGIHTSSLRGVEALLRMVEADALQGAWVADKVVGQAAAALLLRGGVRRVHAEVISEPAYRMLNEARVRVTYEKRVPEIRNRDNSGLCPLEALYRDCPDKEQYLQRLREFVEKE